jgi:predicted metal-dependent enzyme (double-stranded beta helix superfamily)
LETPNLAQTAGCRDTVARGLAPQIGPCGSAADPGSAERTAVAAFTGYVNALRDLRGASVRTRLAVLGALRALAPAIERSASVAPPDRYGRRVLREDPVGWSLAAISLRYGQQTEAHDHDGWGGAVTVQGIERDRRYRPDGAGDLRPIGERDYPSGAGYVFDPSDIHQPVGADSRQLTIALHFLVHDRGAGQHRHEDRARPVGAAAVGAEDASVAEPDWSGPPRRVVTLPRT